MGESIKFSILVPVYNVEQYLDECVRSVLEQTYQNFELILVDDGSKDNSGIICDSYASRYPFIHVYHKPNAGLIHTRRYAFEKASGDFCVILDSDDYLEKNTLQVIFDAATHYQCDMVIYGAKRVTNHETIGLVGGENSDPLLLTSKRDIYKRMFSSSAYNSLCRKAFKRSLLQGMDYSQFFHLKHAEDLLQSVELLENAEKVVFLPDFLYNYRVNPGSITQTVCYENYHVDFTIRQYVLDFIHNSNTFTQEDFRDYRSSAIWILISELETISAFSVPFEKKKLLFDQITNHPYYRNFICKGPYAKKQVGKKHIIFRLFRLKQYRIMVFLASTVKKIRQGRMAK